MDNKVPQAPIVQNKRAVSQGGLSLTNKKEIYQQVAERNQNQSNNNALLKKLTEENKL
jgi:hypothetical protein